MVFWPVVLQLVFGTTHTGGVYAKNVFAPHDFGNLISYHPSYVHTNVLSSVPCARTGMHCKTQSRSHIHAIYLTGMAFLRMLLLASAPAANISYLWDNRRNTRYNITVKTWVNQDRHSGTVAMPGSTGSKVRVSFGRCWLTNANTSDR